MSASTVHPELRVRDVPRIHCESPARFRNELASSDTPAIVTGLVEQWPAFREWSLQSLSKRFGELQFRVGVRMPRQHSPYAEAAADHIEEMSFADAVALISGSDEATYVRRQHLQKFPGALEEVGLRDYSPDDGRPKNFYFWLGSNTLTGLHFDFSQGMLCQIFGSKTVYFARPQDCTALNPRLGSVSKTDFLPSQPDFEAFPTARDVEFWVTDLNAGELLVVPRMWWHSVVASGVSLSVSHDFGQTLSMSEMVKIVAAGGLPQFTRVFRDFVYHGVLSRPFVRQLTDDPPFGRLLYEMLVYSLRSRLPH